MGETPQQSEFSAVVTVELNALYRTALRILHDHSEAEDAVQEALDKGWRNLDRFEPGTRMKPWLFRILTNTCLDHLRSRARQANVPFDEDRADFAAGDANQKAVDDQQADRELARMIDDEVRQLPPAQRAEVQLVIVEQFSYQDAAETLGVPIGTVRSRLSRARARLSDVLGHHLDGHRAPEEAEAPHLRLVKRG